MLQEHNPYDSYNKVDDNKMKKESDSTPSLLTLHGAVIIAEILFGSGAVVAVLGLPATNPVLFALIREAIAGPILCIIAYCKSKQIVKYNDYKLFIGPGIMLFLNQLCFIVGLKLSSSITASAWQPSQSILAVLYGYCFGIERIFNKYKICGILIATLSALFMILYDDNNDNSNNKDIWHRFGGSIFLFINCSASVFYLILSKPAFEKYPPSIITGYSYIVASFLMVFAAFIVSYGPHQILDAICSDCNGNAWNVPFITIFALIYWILFQSVTAYLLITFANKYIDPSINKAYSVLQPMVSSIFTEILLLLHVVPKCNINSSNNPDNCIYGVSYNDLGAIGIVFGLYLVIYSQRKQKQKQMQIEQINCYENQANIQKGE